MDRELDQKEKAKLESFWNLKINEFINNISSSVAEEFFLDIDDVGAYIDYLPEKLEEHTKKIEALKSVLLVATLFLEKELRYDNAEGEKLYKEFPDYPTKKLGYKHMEKNFGVNHENFTREILIKLKAALLVEKNKDPEADIRMVTKDTLILAILDNFHRNADEGHPYTKELQLALSNEAKSEKRAMETSGEAATYDEGEPIDFNKKRAEKLSNKDQEARLEKLDDFLGDKSPQDIYRLLDMHAEGERQELENWLENRPDIDELVDLILENFPPTPQESYE